VRALALAVALLPAACGTSTSAPPAAPPACRDRAAAVGRALAAARATHQPVARVRVELIEQAGEPAPADPIVVELAPDTDAARVGASVRGRDRGRPLVVAVDARTPWRAVAAAMDELHLAGEGTMQFLVTRPVPKVELGGTLDELAARTARVLGTCLPAVDVARKGDPDAMVREMPAALEKCGCTADVDELERVLVAGLAAGPASQDVVAVGMPGAATSADEIRPEQVFVAPPADTPWRDAHAPLFAAGAGGRRLILPPEPPVPAPPPPPPPPARPKKLK
jgi:hypothetical protein